jgi:hypothetical protein
LRETEEGELGWSFGCDGRGKGEKKQQQGGGAKRKKEEI